MSEHAFPDLRNKALAVYLRNRSAEYANIIEYPEFEMQGGRVFLVGTVANCVPYGTWNAGARTAIAWDEVEQYIVFDSVEEYLDRCSKHSRGWRFWR